MRIATAALVALALLSTGCDLIERMKNEKVMAATLVQPPGAESLTGLPVTGGGLAVASVFFGNKEGGVAGSGALTPLAADSVTVSWGSPATTVSLDPVLGKPGWYGKTGGGLEVRPNTEYTFTVVEAGETFTGKVTSPAAKSEISSLDGTDVRGAAANVRSYNSFGLDFATDGTFTLGRAGDTAPLPVAFYTVHGIGLAGAFDANATPSCTNVPQDAAGLLQLIVDPSAFQVASFELPKTGDCFQRGGGAIYVMTLTTASTAVLTGFSANLSPASAAIVGMSDAAAVTVTLP